LNCGRKQPEEYFSSTLEKENACDKYLNEKARMHSAGFCLNMYVYHGQVSSGILKYIWRM